MNQEVTLPQRTQCFRRKPGTNVLVRLSTTKSAGEVIVFKEPERLLYKGNKRIAFPFTERGVEYYMLLHDVNQKMEVLTLPERFLCVSYSKDYTCVLVTDDHANRLYRSLQEIERTVGDRVSKPSRVLVLGVRANTSGMHEVCVFYNPSLETVDAPVEIVRFFGKDWEVLKKGATSYFDQISKQQGFIALARNTNAARKCAR